MSNEKTCGVCEGKGQIVDVRHKRNGSVSMKLIRCPLKCKSKPEKEPDLRDSMTARVMK